MTPNHPDTEAALEEATVSRFRSMGYEVANLYHETFGSNNSHGREASSEVVFTPRLRKALKKLNPDLPADAIESAIELFTRPYEPPSPTGRGPGCGRSRGSGSTTLPWRTMTRSRSRGC